MDWRMVRRHEDDVATLTLKRMLLVWTVVLRHELYRQPAVRTLRIFIGH
jgi:hypothetical protein